MAEVVGAQGRVSMNVVELAAALVIALKELGVVPAQVVRVENEVDEPVQAPEPMMVPRRHDEVNTVIARKMLAEKGWKVKAYHSFQAVLDEYGVVGKKRGREMWYKTTDINNIPDRV
jgi:capsular polysaccharide biosynthesis protein